MPEIASRKTLVSMRESNASSVAKMAILRKTALMAQEMQEWITKSAINVASQAISPGIAPRRAALSIEGKAEGMEETAEEETTETITRSAINAASLVI